MTAVSEPGPVGDRPVENGHSTDPDGYLRRTLRSLRSRNFRLFFAGQLISNSGSWISMVALTVLVLHRTDSGSAVGALTACQFGPMLLLSAWAGLIADRSDKRRLLAVTQGLEMLQSFTLAVLAFLPGTPMAAFYVSALAGGCMLAFDSPARRSFVNEMVPVEDVPNAVSLYNAMVALSRVIGPAIAGGLVVAVGYGWCFTIDGASYSLVLIALALMRPSELRRATAVGRGRGQIRLALRYIQHRPELWISFALLLVIGMASYNFNAVLPLFAERGLGGSDRQYTLVFASYSAGGVLGTLAIAHRHRVTLGSVLAGATGLGGALLLLSAAPTMAFAYPAAALVGAGAVAYMTSTTTLAQLQADSQMVGRVLALQTVLVFGTAPIGGPVLGYLADIAGGRAPVIVGGVAALGAAALAWLAHTRVAGRGTQHSRTTEHAGSTSPELRT